MSKLLTKAKGLHLALDDIKYHKGKNLDFVVAVRLSLLKILKVEENFVAPWPHPCAYIGGLVRSPKLKANVVVC